MLARRARAQLTEIYVYSERTWSMGQANSYVSRLFQAFAAIADNRLTSRPIAAEFGVEGRYSSYREHFIYWRLQQSGRIEIVAVVGQRRLQSRQVRLAFRLPI